MLTTAGLAPYDLIKELARRMRCRECDEKGGVDISIEWRRRGHDLPPSV
jgi:hypothetical protein